MLSLMLSHHKDCPKRVQNVFEVTWNGSIVSMVSIVSFQNHVEIWHAWGSNAARVAAAISRDERLEKLSKQKKTDVLTGWQFYDAWVGTYINIRLNSRCLESFLGSCDKCDGLRDQKSHTGHTGRHLIHSYLSTGVHSCPQLSFTQNETKNSHRYNWFKNALFLSCAKAGESLY